MFVAILVGVAIPVSFGCWLIHYVTNLTLYQPQDAAVISPRRWLTATFFPILVFTWGLRTCSINNSGAVAGFMVGFVMTLGNACFATSMLTAFMAGSKVTKFRSHIKRVIEHDFKEGGQRNWLQVICNAGPACQLAIFYIIEVGCRELPLDFATHYTASGLSVAVLSALAFCLGDTFASEIGPVVGGGNPRLITSLRRVPKGTNGGVSLVGTIASMVGGLLVGVAFYTTLYLSLSPAVWQAHPKQWLWVVYGGVAGVMGSGIDSLLGATLQYSGYHTERKIVVERPGKDVVHICGYQLLDNHGVNIVSSILTAIVMPFVAFHTWTRVV